MTDEILGLDPALGLEAEYAAATVELEKHGISLVFVRKMRTDDWMKTGWVEARTTKGDPEHCWCFMRPNDGVQSLPDWLRDVTSESIENFARMDAGWDPNKIDPPAECHAWLDSAGGKHIGPADWNHEAPYEKSRRWRSCAGAR